MSENEIESSSDEIKEIKIIFKKLRDHLTERMNTFGEKFDSGYESGANVGSLSHSLSSYLMYYEVKEIYDFFEEIFIELSKLQEDSKWIKKRKPFFEFVANQMEKRQEEKEKEENKKMEERLYEMYK